MTATAARAYAHREPRHISMEHVAKSAFGASFLAIAVYEAAPSFGYAVTDTTGFIVGGVGFLVGGLIALWR